jgi:phosphatidylinositol alpha-1,6-mannosyltransferase
MKVLYATPGVFDKGGISRYGRFQIQSIRDLMGDANVRVASMLGPDENSFESPFHVDWSCAHAYGRRARIEMVAATLRLALLQRPDIVITAHVNMSGVGRLAALLTGARSVVQVYGSEVWADRRWSATWGLTGSDAVISDCHFTARYMDEQRIRPAGSTRVLWDCVDTARFTPGEPSEEVLQRYGIPDPRTHINLLTLGRMARQSPTKGYDRLLQVFARLQDLGSLRLLFGGGGDLVEDLRAEANRLGVADRVQFLGFVHEDDLADVYRSAEIFSLVSHRTHGHGEGIPLTPLEAAACGKPILVGNQDGSQEAVVGEENGFVVDPHDLEAHAERIRRLAENPELRRSMGSAARRRIERFHTYEVFRSRLGRFLDEISSGQ